MDFTCEILHQPVFSCIHRRAPYLAASWKHVKWVFSHRETFKIILQKKLQHQHQKHASIKLLAHSKISFNKILLKYWVGSCQSSKENWTYAMCNATCKLVPFFLRFQREWTKKKNKLKQRRKKRKKLKRRRFYHPFVNITWHQTKWISAPTNL